MLGHRGIVAGGWKAVTVHDPTHPARRRHVGAATTSTKTSPSSTTSPTPSRTILQRTRRPVVGAGGREPGAAGRRTRRRRNPPKRPVRRNWTLWPGLERVPSDAAPLLRNTSHTITAHVTVPEGGCEGVVIADGDRWGGYVMFVQDGAPCFHYHFPLERHEVRGTVPTDPRRSHDHVDARQGRPHGVRWSTGRRR